MNNSMMLASLTLCVRPDRRVMSQRETGRRRMERGAGVGYEDAFLQYLVSNGRVTAEQLEEAEKAAERDQSRPTGQLVRLGFLSSGVLAESLSAYLEEPMVKINPAGITKEAAALVDEEMAVHNSVVPVQVSDRHAPGTDPRAVVRLRHGQRGGRRDVGTAFSLLAPPQGTLLLRAG